MDRYSLACQASSSHLLIMLPFLITPRRLDQAEWSTPLVVLSANLMIYIISMSVSLDPTQWLLVNVLPKVSFCLGGHGRLRLYNNHCQRIMFSL